MSPGCGARRRNGVVSGTPRSPQFNVVAIDRVDAAELARKDPPPWRMEEKLHHFDTRAVARTSVPNIELGGPGGRDVVLAVLDRHALFTALAAKWCNFSSIDRRGITILFLIVGIGPACRHAVDHLEGNYIMLLLVHAVS